MNNITICDKCGQEFTLDEYRFGIIRDGDLTVQYFTCPVCGERFQFFTLDKEMRELVARRKAVQMQIRAGHAKKFSRKTLRKYEQELEKIRRQQEKMIPALKAVGEKILHGGRGRSSELYPQGHTIANEGPAYPVESEGV